MHVFTAIPHHDGVRDVRVIARLAQVVCELDAVITALDQAGGRVDAVGAAYATSQDLVQPGLLGREPEPDLGSEPVNGPRSDAQVIGGPAVVGDLGPVLSRVAELRWPGTVPTVDAARDAEGRQQALRTPQ